MYFQPSEKEQAPSCRVFSSDILVTQRPVTGWKINLYEFPSMIPGPAQEQPRNHQVLN